ncbi:MAG: hypothetical protein L3K02_04235 [Thermoplasmata archaeon]|nr:hypothetical protein [Thermoplasmata archaeon]
MVDYRLVMGIVGLADLGLVLVRLLYPSTMPATTRNVLDVAIVVLLAAAVGLLLKVLGVL